MNKWWYVVGISCLALSSGCGEPAVQAKRCIAELAEAPVVESVIVDVELVVPGLVDRPAGEPHWPDMPSITTVCEAPERLPGQYYFPGRKDAAEYVKAVGIMHNRGVTGVLFAYESRGAEET